MNGHVIFALLFVFFSLLCHQILVPLPEAEARQAMFEELLPSVTSKLEVPYDVLVEKTEGYSGSDIRLVCKEAAMQPLRRLMSVLEASDEVVPEDGEFSSLDTLIWNSFLFFYQFITVI